MVAETVYVQVNGERVEASGEVLAQIIFDRETFEAGAYERAYAEVEQARQVAYRETSDALFFEYQRGDATEAEWLAAVQAVKDAHPYPEEIN